MNPDMRKRLEKIESKFGSNKGLNIVWFGRLDDETDADYEVRLDRWYAGDKVEGVDGLYDASEVFIVVTFNGNRNAA